MKGPILACMAILMAATAHGGETPALESVQLAATAAVEGAWVTLGDIATVHPADERLLTLGIAPSPTPGGTRSVTAGYVRVRLRAAGIDPGGAVFSGAQRVQVTRAPLQAQGATPAAQGQGTPAFEAGAPVRRGTLLTLEVRHGPLLVEARGELLRDCAVGQVGRVRVEGTRALVQALLLDRATAQVMTR